MGAVSLNFGRVFLIRVDHDSDIIGYVSEFARKNRINAATFTAIGALKSCHVGFYDQQKHAYLEEAISVPVEIASCIGNVSLKDGEPFVHAHAVLSFIGGETRAGHLLEGKVFAAEIHLTELRGDKVERKPDAVTGLSLWDF